jgi:hypothetical protein
MKLEESIRAFEGQPLTRQIMRNLLTGYRRPYDKIAEMVKKELLVPVKRGIFVAGPALHIRQPEPFLLANHLNGPSYLSMESALSYWGLIPERVFEIASATIRRSRIYATAVGRFSYVHLPLPYYSFGQRRIELTETQAALIATPEKALCDKIVVTTGLNFRSETLLREWLIEDMRMDRDSLRKLDTNLITSWLDDSPKQKSLDILTKTLKGL